MEKIHYSERGRLFWLRNLLNILFILIAIVGVAVYLLQDKTIGTYIVLGAMGIKIIETSLRIMKL